MEHLRRQLLWLIAIRLVIVTSIALPYFLLDTFLPTTTVREPVGVLLPEVEEAPAGEAPTEEAPAGEAPTEEAPVERPAPPGAAPPETAPPETAPPGEAGSDGGAVGETGPRGLPPALERGTTTVVIAERQTSAIGAGLIYRAAGLVYLASILYLLLLRLVPRRPQLHAYLQFLGDLLLITALVYFTGAITSPFSLFYLVVIAVASTLLRRQAGFTVATGAYLLYATTLLGIYFGRLPVPEAQGETGDPIYRLTYNLVVHFVGFYAVAILTSLLAHRVSRAEQELEEKSEDLADLQVLHRDVIQSITSGLITTGLDGRVTSLNRAGEEILQSTEREVLGSSVQDLLGPDRWRQLTDPSHGPPSSPPSRSEVELYRGGSPLYVGFSLSPLTDASGSQRGWNVVFQDLTRWRALEEEVRMKDRMAAVGELAAGIAHEIGNPLAAISGSVQMLAQAGDGDPAQRKLLGILLKESQRLDRIIKGFLRFARPRERSTVEFDVAHLLTENVELLRNSEEVGEHHQISLELDPASTRLVADPDQVSQIFWNLARNALKAMPSGGTLEIGGRLRGESYLITFRDTGRGMSDEQRARLFHPFQSFFDSGTGIGMAIVYRIVQEHGGEVRVQSTEALGTTITVELPLHAPSPDTAGEAVGGRAGESAEEPLPALAAGAPPGSPADETGEKEETK